MRITPSFTGTIKKVIINLSGSVQCGDHDSCVAGFDISKIEGNYSWEANKIIDILNVSGHSTMGYFTGKDIEYKVNIPLVNTPLWIGGTMSWRSGQNPRYFRLNAVINKLLIYYK